ncbi:BrnT family toxin [Cupriavidus gilardii]|uniref:BrnT family toxin n=1 Tax=Cupriavidus gilardii TaxID=82541 RepID=UPI001EE56CAD|nr:BrnT family toxin [Cupriavidus gilardii]MCG5260166.1 BrnT family toxin [Cupriavidus gilardii]MDF9429431.1 BrnT family toxin [Cupriavidus gilardii]
MPLRPVLDAFVDSVQAQHPRRFSVVAKYGETRYIAYAPIGTRLHCLVFTLRGDTLRAISLRKANFREVRDYEQEI